MCNEKKKHNTLMEIVKKDYVLKKLGQNYTISPCNAMSFKHG